MTASGHSPSRHSKRQSTHTASFKDIWGRIHSLLTRLHHIEALRKHAKNNPHHNKHAAWVRQADEWEKHLRDDAKNPADLSKHNEHKVTEKDHERAFNLVDHDRSDEITLIELQAAITSAVARLHINTDTLLCGWTVPELFRIMDADCSGKISLREWKENEKDDKSAGRVWNSDLSKEQLHKDKEQFSDKQMDNLVNDWDSRHQKDDKDPQKEISRERTASQWDIEANAQDMLKAQFRKWDKDKVGFITKQQLGQLLKTLNPMFRESSLEDVMKEVDKNGNGQIEYEEFVDFIFHQDEVFEHAGSSSVW